MAEQVNQRDQQLKNIKAQLRPLIKRANQRILRLEQQGLTSSPAYQKVTQMLDDVSKPRFGVRGKSLEDLQDDRVKLNNFLEYKTSTIGGTKEQLQRFAKQMQRPYAADATRLYSEASGFFRIANKITEYIRSSSSHAHIDSDVLFRGISRAIDLGVIDLTSSDLDLSQIEEIIGLAIDSSSMPGTGDIFRDLATMSDDDIEGIDFDYIQDTWFIDDFDPDAF